MLMREPTITNKKRSEKGRTICEIGTASPPRHPRILHPVRTFTPPQRRTAAWPGGEEREKGRRPSLTPSASPSRNPAHAKVSPRKEKPQLTVVRNSEKSAS